MTGPEVTVEWVTCIGTLSLNYQGIKQLNKSGSVLETETKVVIS